MKIAVTSQNFRTVTAHAGHTRRFLVYEVEANREPIEVERLDLPKELAMHEWHEQGPHPLDAVDVLIAGSFGEGFGRRLAARGITVVATEETDPLAAVKAYAAGVATVPAAIATGGCCHGHGHDHHHRHRHGHHPSGCGNPDHHGQAE